MMDQLLKGKNKPASELRLVSVYLLYANLWLYNGFSLELKFFAHVLIAYVYLIFLKVTLHCITIFLLVFLSMVWHTFPHVNPYCIFIVVPPKRWTETHNIVEIDPKQIILS